jgi:hypothetical protein
MKEQLTRGLRVAAIVAAGGAAALFGFAAPASAAAPAPTVVVAPASHHSGHQSGHHQNRKGHGSRHNNHRQSGSCSSRTRENWGVAMCDHLSRGTRVTLHVSCTEGGHGRRTVEATRTARRADDSFTLRASCGRGHAVRAWTTISGHRH